MKELLRFKKFIIVILLAGLSLAGWSQALYEDFNYATPAYIGGNAAAGTTSNNWTTHSVTAGQTTTIDIIDGSLTYTGLSTSTGNKAYIPGTNSTVSRDINRAFTSTATVLYYSALINVVDATQLSAATVDYFMSFGASSGTAVTSLAGRLGIKSVNTAANYRLCVGNNSGGTLVYTDFAQDLNFGTTYLVVVKLDRSTSPITASLWVNPSNLGGSEPSGSVTCTSGTGAFAAFASICIRNGAGTPKANIDEIRVGETWAAVTPATAAAATIIVTSPVADYQWTQGTSHDINWTATGTNADVMIEYSANASDASPTWTTINASIAANSGVWSSWDIPADQPLSADSKIRITDIPQTATGLSGIFKIIAAPAPVATFSPVNAATGVDITSDITITYDVPVRNIDDSEITDANVASLLTLTTTDALGTAILFTATIDASKKVITINPDTDLEYEQLIYVAVAPVEGLSNNATIAQNITFTTVANLAPALTGVSITEVAPYYAGDVITINWTSKNITDVQIEAWIPSENSWSIIIPTTPSDGTETFAIPADAQYSTDYKIRVTDIANAGVSAESNIFTIIAVANDLLTLRALPVNSIVKYTGIATITFSRPTTLARNQKYIQDATAAVLIDDPTAAPGFITGTYNIGDGITNVVGKIVLYGQLVELTPFATTGEPATGNEIVPEIRTLASLTSADQCKLVKIEDFAFKTPTQYDVNGLFVKSKSYDINGFVNTGMVYRTTFAESDYIGGKVPVGPISSVCLVGQYNAQMQITARSWSDMVIPTAVIVTSPNGGESYEQGSIQTITWTSTNFTGDVKIELTGSNPSVIETSVANTGSYTWNVPAALAIADDYKVKISDAIDGDPMDESDAAFSVVEVPFVSPALVITEIMYTSPDISAKQEWVELYNNGTTSVDVEGFYILDSDPLHKADPIVLPAGAVIAPGEYYTIETSDNGQPELFPFVPDFVSIKFNLGKTDEVKLFHSNGKLIDSVSYSYLAPWPTSPNGGGSSLTLCDPNLDNSLASSWEASEDAFTTLQGTTIFATPGSGCVLHTAVTPKLQSGILVYPNPTSDNLYISNPANGMLEITVMSAIGKAIKSIQSNQGVTSIDLSNMPKGIYMVKMVNKTLKTTEMKKVVVN